MYSRKSQFLQKYCGNNNLTKVAEESDQEVVARFVHGLSQRVTLPLVRVLIRVLISSIRPFLVPDSRRYVRYSMLRKHCMEGWRVHCFYRWTSEAMSSNTLLTEELKEGMLLSQLVYLASATSNEGVNVRASHHRKHLSRSIFFTPQP
jgi:hypothetical protein